MNRGFIISLLLLLQLSFFFVIAWKLGQEGIYVYIAFSIVGIILTISILNRSFNPAYKIGWMLIVLIIPFAGSIFYLMFGRLYISRRRRRKINKLHNDTQNELRKNYRHLDINNRDVEKTMHYITNVSGLQAWDNTYTKLLTPGEVFFEEMLEELKKAKRFIFLEYFIIENGFMWDSIVKVLEEKVKDGVDVRLIYDDFGTISKVGFNFKRDLVKKGIKVITFNPFRPRLSMIINYRDHRKITVIDGNVGFVGGNNLADEYINKVKRFGHWKDASLVLKGDGVWNLTFLFLEMWQSASNDSFVYEDYYPTLAYPSKGFVQVFGDGPQDNHQSIEMVYMQIINNAKNYIYITTPYLIIDNEIATALKLAALSGIDVRIMTPHIPDKKVVFMITRSYYSELIKAGVKIYEYLPGFLHSKLIVADDEVAMIGTTNLDYRSFYLHFEVSCYLYNTDSVIEMREDAIKCLEVAHLVTYEESKQGNLFKKIIVAILKAFSPLI
jgi:cardiolipin synthase